MPETPDDQRASPIALDFERYVPAFLTYLAGKYANEASAIYRPKFGVGVTDWRIMALLGREPWISPRRVCDMTGLDKAAVSRSVRAMSDAGYVEVRSKAKGSNRQIMALTQRGLELHDHIVALSLKREEKLLAALEPQERRMLVDFLRRMQAQVDSGATVSDLEA